MLERLRAGSVPEPQHRRRRAHGGGGRDRGGGARVRRRPGRGRARAAHLAAAASGSAGHRARAARGHDRDRRRAATRSASCSATPRAGRGVSADTARIVLCAVRVEGVPDISVEEALWTCADILHQRLRTAGRSSPWLGARPVGKDSSERFGRKGTFELWSLRRAGTPTTPPAGDTAGVQAFALPLRRDVDEAAARRSLREQIAHLERELAALFTSAHPRQRPRVAGARSRRPAAAGHGRARGAARRPRRPPGGHAPDPAATAPTSRPATGERIEEMVAEPERFKWVRISNDDIGEPGCKHWHARPRLGLIGMLMGWWRVKISSGCP